MKGLSKYEAKELQLKLSKKVITKNILPKNIKRVCGVDASYKDDKAYCAAVIFDEDLKEIEKACVVLNVSTAYIPGLFMLKEATPILKALKKIKKKFDVLMVDGHGQLHPRKCGLACYVGLTVDAPTIGVAKRLLCGKVKKDSKVELAGKALGYQISHKNKKIYVSTGHKISLKTAVRLVKAFTKRDSWYPEPLKMADFYSKKVSRMNKCY